MEFAETITLTDFIYLAGLILLACWLLRTSLGRKALADSVPRRNNMPLYLPFIPLFIWFGAISMAILIAEELLEDLEDWQRAFLDNFILGIGSIATIAVIIFLVRAHFARRLKGFGLNIKTIVKDFFVAFINLLTVWPLVIAAITITIFFGKLIWGQDYQIQQHQELEILTEYSQLSLRIIIFIVAVVMAPLLEEMLFRGLVQTMLVSRISYLVSRVSSDQQPATSDALGAWFAIAISSGLFAIIHANAGHWPALFVLGVCLGYSYEKSGSLFRPIFIHSLFNAASLIATLYQ